MAGAVTELADAQALNKTELLARIKSLTLDFLRAVERGDDPELHLVFTVILSFHCSCPLRLYVPETMS